MGRGLTRRHTLALTAFFLAVGLALSVSWFALSKGSTAKESVSQKQIAEDLALTQESNNAAFSQYVENPPPAPVRLPVPSTPNPKPGQRDVSDSENFVSQGSIAEGEPTLPKEHFSPYSQVVDNSAPHRFKAPGWATESSRPNGYRKDYRLASPSKAVKAARFRVKIPATDTYSVYAWWPARGNNNAEARFGVRTTAGVRWTKVNQRREGGLWVKLGEYRMEAGDRYAVRVAATSRRGGQIVADAVAVVRGVLSAPPERSYELAADEGATHAQSTSSIKGERIVEVARTHMGTSYSLSPPAPCQAFSSEDCSCHTSLVFEKFGIQLPDSPSSQWHYGQSVAKDKLQPGDLVFFKEEGPSNPISHVGIYAGRGYLIHASSYYGKVVESEMRYIEGYYGAKRL
jgi:cell wall-associated NlpC family hydrolase